MPIKSPSPRQPSRTGTAPTPHTPAKSPLKTVSAASPRTEGKTKMKLNLAAASAAALQSPRASCRADSTATSVASSTIATPQKLRNIKMRVDTASSPFNVMTPERRMSRDSHSSYLSAYADTEAEAAAEAELVAAAQASALASMAAEVAKAEAAGAAAQEAMEAAERARAEAAEAADKAASEHAAEVSGLHARLVELQEAHARELELRAKQEAELRQAHEREIAQRTKEEAERTLEKVEELWRVAADCEKLRGENAALRADKEREAIESAILREALASTEEREQRLLVDTAEAQLAVVQLETALASFNRHAVGICHDQMQLAWQPGGAGAGFVAAMVPNRHRARPSATFKSNSPRFPNGAQLAMHGVRANANNAMGEEARLRHAARRARHDLGIPPLCLSGECACGHKDFDALTRVLSAGISLGKRAGVALQ